MEESSLTAAAGVRAGTQEGVGPPWQCSPALWSPLPERGAPGSRQAPGPLPPRGGPPELLGKETGAAFLALREPSRWMVMSAPFIIRRLWPDRMLPTRSGTGASSTSGSGAAAGTLLLESPTDTGLATGR